MEHSGLWTPDPTEHGSSIPLSSLHISQAKQASKDGCATLSFARLNLTNISTAAVEELLVVCKASSSAAPQRITLGFNRLDRLPSEFVLLSHLRYLNLERNNFTVFPDVLVSMPALDILDISHNKIRKLPSEAGQLARLRILCLKRNKLTHLPDYLREFRDLEILQIEKNPLEWPPPRVIDAMSESSPQQPRSVNVQALQHWLETNKRENGKPDLSGYSDPSSNDLSDRDWHSQLSATTDHNFDRWPHSRTFSVESSLSMTSIAERLEDDESVEPDNDGSLSRLPKFLADSSQDEHSAPSSDISDEKRSATDGESTKGPGKLRIEIEPHINGKSSMDLSMKKSMPDLRTARLNFTKKSAVPPVPFVDNLNGFEEYRRSPVSTTRSRLDSDVDVGRGTLRVREADSPSASAERRPTVESPSGSRQSSHPLFSLADTARSIVFAISKVHSSLQQHLTLDEGVDSMARKILEPSGHDLGHLSLALGVFESEIKQKTLPSPAVCRSLVESCKDAVAGFRHALEFLNPSLRPPGTDNEIRLARWLIVEIWAATSELALAWQTFLPMLHSITVWLPARPTLHVFPSRSLSSTAHGNNSHSGIPPSTRTTQLAAGPPATTENGGGRSRRHAGSFSYKDVELGKLLPSNEDFPAFLKGIAQGAAAQTSTLRAPKRHMTIPLTTVQSPSPTAPDQAVSSTLYTRWVSDSDGHSRQSSQTSMYSTNYSPSIPSKSFLDFTSTHEANPTQEAIQAILVAVDTAPPVWDLLESMAQEGSIIDHTIDSLIQTARDTTNNLGHAVNGDIVDAQALQRTAHAFLKTVVQVSNMVKSFARPQDFPTTLRSKMLELTNATEHFATLLQVMADAPNGTHSRSISPIGSFAPPDSAKTLIDELSLSTSLSRGRSVPPAVANGQYLLPSSANSFTKVANSRSTPAFDQSFDRRHGDPG